MSWPMVTLGEICEFKYGKSLPAKSRRDGSIPVYGSNGQVGTHDKQLTDGYTIVIGRKGSFGEVHLSKKACWPIDTTYFVDQTCTHQHLGWLRHMLPLLGLTRLNRAAAVPGLSREDAYRQKLLLPPLDEQRRIAAILDQGQRVQERMHLILNTLDKFQESIFETMFGQGGSAKESSTVSTIGSQLKLKSGEFLPASSQQEGAYPVYGGNGINGFHSKYIFDESMIVIGRVGAQCGAVHLTRPRAWVTDNALVATEIDTPIDRLYLRDALSAANLNQFANQSGQPSISQKRIANVPLLIPSPESQNAYRFRLSKIDEVRTVALKNIKLSHELLRSLQTRAFRGEL
ncbi:restriction endonuclease subunit S [Dietzia kunjamensis]|uniref:restriction endonuclease subunit S n=1 Tax=Dietzia kunjamensis TaxID=322509 RepID=UPI0039BCCBD0